MTVKDILVPVLSLEADEAALIVGGGLAAQLGGRATAVILGVGVGSEFANQQSPLSDVLADLAAGARSAAAVERAKIVRWLEGSPHAFEVRDIIVENALARDELVSHARVADLIVAARSTEHARARTELIEDILFKSGRPLLLTPPAQRGSPRFDRVLVAWNAKAEAVHAVAGAMPLIAAAERVRVVTIDAAPSPGGHGQAPGRDLAAYLARHGARVEVANVDGLGREAGQALLDAALDFAADLIVMGAYGHSRAHEFVLGGATRFLLQTSPTPLLLAH